MTDIAELKSRFDRVLNVLGNVIDSVAALDPAWEERKKGVEGAYADAALACSKARQAFEDETPTMDALVISLKDNRYKNPSWPADGANDAQMLRSVWYSFHNIIVAGKHFAPDDLSVMRNLYAAIEAEADRLEADTKTGKGLLPRPSKTMPNKPAEHPEWLEWRNAICKFTNASKFSVTQCWDTHKRALLDIAGVVDRTEFVKIYKQIRERLRQNKKK